MIVCDIFSRCGFVAADAMGIPAIVIMALPWLFCAKFGFIENPSFERNGRSCCGCICLFRPLFSAFIRDLTPVFMKDHPETAKAMLAHHKKRTVICTSFFGLEAGEVVPPNVTLTGPFSDPPSDLLPVLKEKDETLYNWLD